MRYRKKPVVIDAWPWAKYPSEAPVHGQPDIYPADAVCTTCEYPISRHLRCDTLEGQHIVCPGDWLIRGIKGEFYPCKPDIFAATYESVE